MQNLNRKLGKRGQGLVEYVLVVVLMGLLAIGSLKFLGQKTHNAFKTAGDAVDTQTNYGNSAGQTSGTIGG